ncbi:piggyBac transposable element-derived protein 4-like [Nematolebias whitei]|uniref:piggyBac transposable element-derived protein 4-like n=3 Tax=Nematolebias whitei TaxID=451745 RepID=UPI0018971E73|nr:piggyBac transposable element-derived protein 4-like [Nematolebias whitei]XP_037531871.1 piggyBac transposable element-derived protein 4-like [Nematolebias whitei]XP_037532869.1 piggyBac transposable element-derived protein 4-like [Nematolebias whitei]XP_037533102.1 piggyBac transposable element-derived protein 4-like [Nematolebias whitei]XP_037533530.1 piggyBac transposable element-derived protein 4-like [Nematolebias whitei]XP_037534070.1 piggyBac transposable element-derived protein 4-li
MPVLGETPKMSSRRFTAEEAFSQLMNWDSDVEEEVSETEDPSEPEDNAIDDPDFQFSHDEEDSEDESAGVPSSDENQEMQQSSSTEGTWTSKDGKIKWSTSPHQSQGRLSSCNVIKMIPGPTRFAVTRVDDIESAFQLFISPPIEKIILNMTNLEGKRVFQEKWKPLDPTDLHAYIGILVLAGVYRSKGEATASLWNEENGRPIFRATMSLETFHMISRVIRFDNRDTRADRRERDKLAAIRDVWNKWVEILPLLYNPGPHVTVDERLVPFRGRCPFRQYMPNKPAKYGIKMWAACDAKSSYVWNLQVYTGKPPGGRPEKNQGMRVVLEMTEGLQGHNITCDNFFTSYRLGDELQKRKLTMLGTVRKNKPELPSEILKMQGRPLHSSKFAFTEKTTLVSYCPKRNKNVLVMSTMHKDASLSTREDMKPQMILDYNSTKGGVDNLDKVTATYSCQRKTARWPLVVFYNILDVSAYNAYVLWIEINQQWNASKLYRRRLFLEELGKALVTPKIQNRVRPARSPAAAAVIAKVQGRASDQPTMDPLDTGTKKRKRCQVCPSRDDSKTTTSCVRCKKYICKKHIVTFCPSCGER